MKINANAMASFHRDIPKASQAMRAERTDKAVPVEAGKTTPPGLERALARLQAMEEGQRTAGQTNAMDRIGRNLARYIETQAMAGTPEPEVAETVLSQADDALAESPEAPESVPVAESGVDPVIEMPEAQTPDESTLLDALLEPAADEPDQPVT
jgi:hypothetical protein